jgi:two-component system nitrogen regulation response regulator GlnG
VKVLVADDEKGLTDILSAMIRRKGHSVDVADDGRMACQLLSSKHYDLAFLDFTMPEMTGMEVLQVIKDSGSGTRTVLITAYPFVEDSLARAAGMDEFLAKPIHLLDVERILEKYKK